MTLPAHPLVIRAPEAEAWLDAAAIRERARQDAAAEHARARQQGHQEGLQQGTDTAARLLEETRRAIDAYWAEREAELVPLALALAHRVLAELPGDDLLAGLARTALAEHRQDTRLVLRASPADAAALRRLLSEAGAAGPVVVEADPAMPPGACTLVHARGQTRIGLLDQFRAMLAQAPATP